MSNFKVGDMVQCISPKAYWSGVEDGKPKLGPSKGEELVVARINEIGNLGFDEYPYGYYAHIEFRKKTGNLSMTFIEKEDLIKQREELILLN